MREPAMKPVLVVHGGAARLSAAQRLPAARAPFEAGMGEAIAAGMAVLQKGGAARDAVVEAVAALEDNPIFNAGRGSVYCRDGSVECCASVMCAETERAGAGALIQRVRNPVRAARLVLDHEHTLIVGETLEQLAREAGLDMVRSDYHMTPHRRAQWDRFKHRKEVVLDPTEFEEAEINVGADLPKGTVGAVAFDQRGQLAAATSTGGLVNQLPGRIGDSPVIGAGTWADQRVAVSATGDGDVFARVAFARRIADLIELRGVLPSTAARRALADVASGGGEGGCVMLDARGRVFGLHNSPDMHWASSEDG